MTIPLAPFFVWIMVFMRVALVFAMFPLISERFVPVRIRILIAAMISLAITPVAPFDASLFPLTGGGMARLVACEALLAFSVGFIGRAMFAIIQFAGQIAGQQMGFGLINSIDPTGSNQVSVIAEMQYVLAVLIFFLADLHHIFLSVAIGSFEVLPPGAARLTPELSGHMMELGRMLFSLALQFAMPVIAVIVALDVALGLIARAVPQLNVLFESFPIRIIGGLSITMLSLGFTVTMWEHMFDNMQHMIIDVIGLMG